ncbi:hypothetical protein PS843_03893 [Pseudomonas fluorescens]|nr:hypothetical protein PS843_03893 [Pseudomonas fluorescens]
MLADKDPLAIQLFEQYNRVVMPNLRLGDTEVNALLVYLEEETERLQPSTAETHEEHGDSHGHQGQ